MRFQARTFWLAKDADEPDQFQDAFELDPERGIAAIADGVSSAIFSGPWARVLTNAVVTGPPDLDDSAAFQDWLARQRAVWSGQIDISRLTWYQRPKMVDGAMTTLLWVELRPAEIGEDGLAKNYRLRSFAIGDSCLFHVRQRQTLSMFPLEQSSEFGLNPDVIGSIDRQRDHQLAFKAAEADCLPGDLLVLATDALALWAYHHAEAGEPVAWDDYWDCDPGAWRDEIIAIREASQMRFDDTTLVLLRVIEETPAPAAEPQPTFPTEMVLGDLVLDDGALYEESEMAPVVTTAPEDVVEPAGLEENVEAPIELMESPEEAVDTSKVADDAEPGAKP